MGLKWLQILFCLFIFSGCNEGTEVVNAPQPGTPAKPLKFTSITYEVEITLPEGWQYREYGPDKIPGPEAFTDIDAKTTTIATFVKNEGQANEARFTAFYSTLGNGQSLYDFVRYRRPFGNIQILPATNEAGAIAYVAAFNQTEPGPHGGTVFDAYLAVGNEILWMRAEVNGTNEEKSISLEEINQILRSFKIIQ